MTSDQTPPPITAQELKALAVRLNEQVMELTNQVATVRHLLYQEARRMKKASGPSSRAFSRSKGAPVTVVRGPEGMTTIPGHPELVDE